MAPAKPAQGIGKKKQTKKNKKQKKKQRKKSGSLKNRVKKMSRKNSKKNKSKNIIFLYQYILNNESFKKIIFSQNI